MTDRVAIPTDLLRELIDAAERAYGPAFGGDVSRPHNAARAAQNILDRHATGKDRFIVRRRGLSSILGEIIAR